MAADTERKYGLQNQFMPLTSNNRMAGSIVNEWGRNGRIATEGSDNGTRTARMPVKQRVIFSG